MAISLQDGRGNKPIPIRRLLLNLRTTEPSIRDDLDHLHGLELVYVDHEEGVTSVSLHGDASVLLDFGVQIIDAHATADDPLGLRAFDAQLD